MQSSAEQFLQELRLQYEKEFELKSNLDGKANNIITASGTIAGFLLVFGTFLLGGLVIDSGLNTYATGSLIGGIVTAIGAILASIFSSVLRKYLYALADVSELTIEDKNNKKNRLPNDEVIKDYTSKNENEITQEMIGAYAKSIYNNVSENRKKAIAVLIGQWAFFVSVIFALVLIIVMIQAFNFG
jgi:gas vesicle protein